MAHSVTKMSIVKHGNLLIIKNLLIWAGIFVIAASAVFGFVSISLIKKPELVQFSMFGIVVAFAMLGTSRKVKPRISRETVSAEVIVHDWRLFPGRK